MTCIARRRAPAMSAEINKKIALFPKTPRRDWRMLDRT
jgi:hypothetical protein